MGSRNAGRDGIHCNLGAENAGVRGPSASPRPPRAGHAGAPGDESCTDLDIVVTDVDGDELESDVELDDTPMVIFEAREATTVTVTVSMATCRDDCHYGVGMFTGS
jgi:hypothetical protein